MWRDLERLPLYAEYLQADRGGGNFFPVLKHNVMRGKVCVAEVPRVLELGIIWRQAVVFTLQRIYFVVQTFRYPFISRLRTYLEHVEEDKTLKAANDITNRLCFREMAN
jgi:hypothetical protein